MKHPVWIICCATLLLALMTPLVCAQEEAVKAWEQPIQEVFQTGLVYPQERGEMQLSYTSRFSKGRGHSSLQTPMNLEYGITDRWQIGIEWNAMSRRTETGEATTSGRGDLRIGTQYSFMNMRGSNFHSAVGFEVSFPTGNVEKGLSEGLIEYEPHFSIAKDFPKLHHMQVFSEVGIGFVQRIRHRVGAEEKESAPHNFNLGAGMFMPFNRLVFTGEFNLNTNRWNNGGRERQMYFTPGLVWRLPRNFEIGFAGPVGLTGDADKSGAILRLVYELGTRHRVEAP